MSGCSSRSMCTSTTHSAWKLEVTHGARRPTAAASAIERSCVGHVRISSSMRRTASTASVSVAAARAARASRSAASEPGMAADASSSLPHDHPRPGGEVGRRIDQDEAAGGAVLGVADRRPAAATR